MPGWAERVARVVFGAVVTSFFGLLAVIVIHARFVDRAKAHGARDAGLVASTLFVAAIAVYGLDQFLKGLRPERERWFERSERALEGRNWGAGLRVGRLFGVPVRVHWSAPIGLFLVAGLNVAAACGFVIVVLAHEAGHAVFVRRLRHRVVEVGFHALGGECRWSGTATPRERATIAWGGVLAQALLAAMIEMCRSLLPHLFAGKFAAHLAATLVETNLAMAAFNLLPIPPLDGAEAWRALSKRRNRATRDEPVADVVKKALDRARQGK